MIALVRRVIPLALVCVLSFAGRPTAALPPPPLSAHMQQAIVTDAENELRTFGGHQSIPGVFIALYMPGNAPFIKSVGYANLPGRRPFALPDEFRIGSNTKTFVITVLL